MPASPLSRTARAARTGAALTTLTLAGTALLGAPAAFAAPGDNGDVKIHSEHTSPTSQINEPKVCKFHLAAFNFDVVAGITWTIEPQPANQGSATLNGALKLETGMGNTDTLTLPDGQYKLTWKITGGTGAGKHKVFKVDCKSIPSVGGPNGGVPAGGGGLAEPSSVSAVSAAGAVGLVGVSGFVYVRMLRRRPDGAA